MIETGRGAPPQDIIDSPEMRASKELAELGLEANRENVEAAVSQMRTGQHPEGYEAVVDSLGDPERLKEEMGRLGVKSIVHSEGRSVWDHAKAALTEIGDMDMSEDLKRDLKLIMLYHDLGKTEVADNAENTEATKKKVAKGELHRSMIGHAEAKNDEMRRGLAANGVEGARLERFMTVIANHMKTSLIEQDPKKTVKLFESFGKDEAERQETVRLLTAALQADGNATEHVDLVEGELKYSKNEKKLALDFGAVWGKYEEGRKLVQTDQDKDAKKKADDELEKSIFGMKLSEYLTAQRGVQPGPAMGKAMGKIKGVLAKNKGLAPEEVKKLIDSMEL